jgi:CMP-N,N'-diacetyllegionaminic acid synthase
VNGGIRTLAVVPARGGSKGIPRKNLASLGGEALLLHTLHAASGATLLDRLVVSTDDDEIVAVATAAGAEVVRRPPELGTDDCPTEAVLLHVLETLTVDAVPEYVVTLEPTSPLRTSETIDRCLAHAFEHRADCVIAVARAPELVGRLEAGVFRYLEPGQPRRRQLRTPLYRESGAAYVTRTEHLRRTGSILGEPLYAVVVPEEEAVDVNVPVDLQVAEALLAWRAEGRRGA